MALIKADDSITDSKEIRCSCGCSKLEVILYDDGTDYESVTVCFLSAYLGAERGKLRAIKNVLCNKETYWGDVTLNKDDALKFFESVVDMLKNKI